MKEDIKKIMIDFAEKLIDNKISFNLYHEDVGNVFKGINLGATLALLHYAEVEKKIIEKEIEQRATDHIQSDHDKITKDNNYMG